MINTTSVGAQIASGSDPVIALIYLLIGAAAIIIIYLGLKKALKF
jgi:uncharacterized membrane protein YuzA (DUF378 family)